MLHGWLYKKKLTFTCGTQLRDYQVKLNVIRSEGTDVSGTIYLPECKADFADIRFTDNFGSLIPYWIESVTGTTAVVWVKANFFSVTDIYMYYGNASAVSMSNPDTTMELYDNFTSLNTAKWQVFRGNAVIESGALKAGYTSSQRNRIRSYKMFGPNHALVARITYPTSAAASIAHVGFGNGESDYAGGKIGYGINTGLSPTYRFTYEGSGGETNQYCVSISNYTGSYHIFESRRIGNTASLLVDGAAIVTNQSGASITASFANIELYDANTYIYVDWLYVRKYSAIEPVHTIAVKIVNPQNPVYLPGGNANGFANWSSNKVITITNPGGVLLTDYQVQLTLTKAVFPTAKTYFEDIRFSDQFGNPIPHWIRNDIGVYPTDNAECWVRVPVIPVGGTTIKVYYGNPSAQHASNGDATFLVFDHFTGTSYNATKWNYYSSGGSPTNPFIVANSILTGSCSASGNFVRLNRFTSVTNEPRLTHFRVKSRLCPSHAGSTTGYIMFGFVDYGMAYYSAVDGARNGKLGYWDGSAYTGVTLVGNSNVWMTQEMLYPNNTTVIGKINDTSITTMTYSSIAASANVTFLVGNSPSCNIQCDWVFVASYTANEPVATISPSATSNVITLQPSNKRNKQIRIRRNF